VVDLGGDVRANPKLSGTRHNVFGIQTGVAIGFFVKKAGKRDRGRIFYARRPEMETAEEKLAFLSSSAACRVAFEEIRPDSAGHWLNAASSDFDEHIPLGSKAAKASGPAAVQKTVFGLFSLGISTNRDDWSYAEDEGSLLAKITWFAQAFHSEQSRWRAAGMPGNLGDFVSRQIKWTAELEAHLAKGSQIEVTKTNVHRSLYRPFVRRLTYLAPIVTHRPYQNFSFFPTPGTENRVISVSIARRSAFAVIASDLVANTDQFVPDVGQCFARYRYDASGHRHDNITDWAHKQFTSHYKAGPGKRLPEPSKEGIFHYVYAVLHDPVYRDKYAQNLKREFPRIPLYGSLRADFWRWADWGRTLMDLHIGYESVEPWPLMRTDTPDEKARAAGQAPKCLLKPDPQAGRIAIDSETVLAGVPPEAWSYRLGNRSAIDWVLDQHKERKPKDPTIRAKFDTYRFADHKERVIELLARVLRVSVETLRIVQELKGAPR
jgi:predicted helicase